MSLILTVGAKRKMTERGIRIANAPAGRSDLVSHDGQYVRHINSTMNIMERPIHIDRSITSSYGGQGISNGYSGAIKYRFRDYRKFAVPTKIVSYE